MHQKIIQSRKTIHGLTNSSIQCSAVHPYIYHPLLEFNVEMIGRGSPILKADAFVKRITRVRRHDACSRMIVRWNKNTRNQINIPSKSKHRSN
jgi:hypothetical protein